MKKHCSQYRFTVCILFALLVEFFGSSNAESAASMKRWHSRLSRRQATGFTNQNVLQADCGADSICKSNLNIKALAEMERLRESGNIKWITGENTDLKVYLDVINTGEDATNPTLTVTFPEYIHFVILSYNARKYPCTSNTGQLVCSLGSVLKANSKFTFGIGFNAIPPANKVSNFDISLTVDATSEEIDPTDNSVVVNVNILPKIK